MAPRASLAATSFTPTSDEEIVRRVLLGERDLFEVLMRRHNPLVFRAIRGVLRDEARAEDAMQQAWLRAYTHLGEFAGESAFSTWLVRIALNEALGRLRADARLSVVANVPDAEELLSEVSTPSPELRASAREAVELVEQAIDQLPAPYRTVFVLREVEDMPGAEVAAALGISEEAVRVRLHRARLLLREDLFRRVRATARDAFPFLAPRCNRVVAEVMERIARTG